MKPMTFALLFLPLFLTVFGQPAPEEEEEEEEEEDTEPPPSEGPPLQPLCDLASTYGYKCEEHHVVTKDGYKLELYRIPPTMEASGKVILLVHGILVSGETFTIFNNSLGYQLADEGHDVWIAGMRGTVHGRNHTTLNPDTDEKFWDFSWQEIALHDIPNQLDYISEKTKTEQIHYLGHSLGTTVFLIMAIQLPETASKVKSATLLAPIFYFTKYQFMMKEGSSMYNMVMDTMKGFDEKKKWEAFPRTDIAKNEHQIGCEDLPSMGITYCNMGMDMSKQKVGEFMPAGTSKKTLAHLMQGVMSGKPTLFDYGEQQNNKIYGQATPPQLDLKSIKNKLNVFYCDSDHLAAVQDVETLLKETVVETKYFVEDENFNHMDFILPTSEDAKKSFDALLEKLKKLYKK